MIQKKIKPSKIQKKIINYIKKNFNVIKIRAFAGTGKTTTLSLIAESLKNARIIYFVFNKANEEEARYKFPRNTQVITLNAWARSYIKNNTNINVRKIRANYKPFEISERYKCSFEEALLASTIFENFCNSDAHSFLELVGNEDNIRIPKLMFNDMIENQLPCTHSFYFKYYHLLLVHGQVNNRLIYDVGMIDEAQDTNMVTLDIIMRLNNLKSKIFVGDEHQQIYAFRGSKDVMQKIDVEEFILGETYRYNKDIAQQANNFLHKFKGEKDKIISHIEVAEQVSNETCYISRTNGKLIELIDEFIQNDIEFKTVKHPDKIFNLSIDVFYLQTLQKEKIKTNYYLNKFNNIEELKQYAEDIEDIELLSAIKIADKYKNKIFYYKTQAVKYFTSSKKIDTYLTNVHISKGLEWEKVIIMDDFKDFLKIVEETKVNKFSTFRKNIHKVDPIKINEFNLFYVAMTRAKQRLTIESKNSRYLDMTLKDIDIEYLALKNKKEIKEIQVETA